MTLVVRIYAVLPCLLSVVVLALGSCKVHIGDRDLIPSECSLDVECDDGDPCTEDECDADSVCVYTQIVPCACSINTDCNDGNPCTADLCNASRTCEYTTVEPCDCPEQVCTAGPCCDGCTFLPDTEQCSLNALAEDFRCGGSGCDVTIQRHQQFRFCSGRSADCGNVNLQWSDWEDISACGSGQLCVADASGITCEILPAESNCLDGVDNDCNGQIDCADGHCDDQSCGLHGQVCANGTCVCPGGSIESSCVDQADNDCDGLPDCTDPDCAGTGCGPNGLACASGACRCTGNGGTAETTETTCSDSYDNDCDGAVDCADGDCDGRSCDAVGSICSGTTCTCTGNGGTVEAPETTCDDGHDNDCDGLTDCADYDCDTRTCGANGYVCSGNYCVCTGNGGTPQSTEVNCTDGHDNDCDGLTDCADNDCDTRTCGANGRICSGTTCVCSGNGGTVQTTETTCDDGHDNDCDGATDCADSDCRDRACGASGFICCGSPGVCLDSNTNISHCGGCGHVCPSIEADNCTAGQCRCGASAVCASGEICNSGSCGCYVDWTCSGCCWQNTCVRLYEQTDSLCGTGGALCAPCGSGYSCLMGACQ